METASEIWDGDLFKRKEEAEDLIGYLESVAQRPQIRDEGHAHVLAVDTAYGQGKSFFLRRLARHMAHEHAVAYVDAWVDDLEDQPLVALAATLDKALEPWVKKAPGLADRMAEFRSRTGKVAKIVGIGLAKRAASFVIMGSGAEALSDAFAGTNSVVKDLAKDTLKDAGNNAVDDAVKGFGNSMQYSMEERITTFREGQKAISDMKEGLSQIVDVLEQAGMKLPITIIIDELDRCRPTYAIKVLEEVKHLFDVAGVAFVLGMHGQQLAHSVTAAYGVGFDSQSYLRRFFSRRYILRDAALTPLVTHLGSVLQVPFNRFESLPIAELGNPRAERDEFPAIMIAKYMEAYGLKARDAFQFMEMLQTFMILTGSATIILPLIIPMIIAHIKDVKLEELKIVVKPSWGFVTYSLKDENNDPMVVGIGELLDQLINASTMHANALMKVINDGTATSGVRMVANIRFSGSTATASDPKDYLRTLQTVKRFASA